MGYSPWGCKKWDAISTQALLRVLALKKGKRKKKLKKYFLKELVQFFFPVNSLFLREAPQISHLQLQITT